MLIGKDRRPGFVSFVAGETFTRESKRNGTNVIIARFYFCACESSLHISEMKDSAGVLFPVLATVAFPMTSVYFSVMVAVIDYNDQGYGGEKKTSGAQREGFVPRRTTAMGRLWSAESSKGPGQMKHGDRETPRQRTLYRSDETLSEPNSGPVYHSEMVGKKVGYSLETTGATFWHECVTMINKKITAAFFFFDVV